MFRCCRTLLWSVKALQALGLLLDLGLPPLGSTWLLLFPGSSLYPYSLRVSLLVPQGQWRKWPWVEIEQSDSNSWLALQKPGTEQVTLSPTWWLHGTFGVLCSLLGSQHCFCPFLLNGKNACRIQPRLLWGDTALTLVLVFNAAHTDTVLPWSVTPKSLPCYGLPSWLR